MRDIDDDVLMKIDQLASKLKLSRSEYIRLLLRNKTVEEDILQVQEKYESLVKTVLDVLELQTSKVNELLERLEHDGKEIYE